MSEKNEIPLEIQIYNLVNFLPCPLNNEIDLSIYGGSGILNCNNLNDYQNLIKDKINYIINLEQLGAYKHSEINFGKIFEVCSPKLIIQVLIINFLNAQLLNWFIKNGMKLFKFLARNLFLIIGPNI